MDKLEEVVHSSIHELIRSTEVAEGMGPPRAVPGCERTLACVRLG
jgi:hypothetical protein